MKNHILLHVIYIIILLGAFSIFYRGIYDKAELKHIKNQNIEIKKQNVKIIGKLDQLKVQFNNGITITIK